MPAYLSRPIKETEARQYGTIAIIFLATIDRYTFYSVPMVTTIAHTVSTDWTESLRVANQITAVDSLLWKLKRKVKSKSMTAVDVWYIRDKIKHHGNTYIIHYRVFHTYRYGEVFTSSRCRKAILCLSSPTVTSARILEEDYYRACIKHVCFLTRSKKNPGIDAQRMRLAAYTIWRLSDVF